MEERLSALGNVIACNDYVALVHTDLDRVRRRNGALSERHPVAPPGRFLDILEPDGNGPIKHQRLRGNIEAMLTAAQLHWRPVLRPVGCPSLFTAKVM